MAGDMAARIGARIKEARGTKGISQKLLGLALPGVASGDQVSKWERGINRPGDDTLVHIGKALDVDYAFFFSPAQDA